ncbi:MAG: 4-hydroxythreonine-4-phosphate dehydrogenase PdxA [Cyanobacteriota bacterium]|nr:4-hydroxythreonine-4-phosphate dehydrogenase PdxA [Cyanobacteriota bacterium]
MASHVEITPRSNPNALPLVIALGDPAGIGPEVVLKALARPEARGRPVRIVGCRRWLEHTYSHLRGRSAVALADPATLDVFDSPLLDPVTPGVGTAGSGAASFTWLSQAVALVQEGVARGLVTAPIAKAAWHAAGHPHPGQTERLAELCGVDQASMLFTARAGQGTWRFNTLLATTHIPLSQVATRLSAELVSLQLDRLLAFCQRFQPQPRLAVAGLNPHAGEGGALGREERLWMEDCLNAWRRKHPEVRLEGPLPPDTCWLEAARAWQGEGSAPDGHLALYHDQGLIPVKLLAFDRAVNTTLGLPFLRTSPDHGTAFNIAGAGVAREASMMAALETAWELS